MAKRKGLVKFPETVFEWKKAFGDDLGFEATVQPVPVLDPPGSHGKIAAIIERLSRGQSLWARGDAGDGVSEHIYDELKYRVMGSENYGAVVGVDADGHRHRYAVWKRLSGTGARLNYITHTTGYVDSFDADKELSAIERHAGANNASFVSVCGLFSARSSGVGDLRSRAYPVTGIGMLWLRWIARYCDRSIVCWGDDTRADRHVDVLWMLSRTSAGRHVYSVGLTPSGNPSPVVGQADMERFDYKELIADRDKDEIDDDEDYDTAEHHR